MDTQREGGQSDDTGRDQRDVSMARGIQGLLEAEKALEPSLEPSEEHGTANTFISDSWF